MGHVGAGFLANPMDDGAGIIADFLASSPTFTLPNLVSANYTAANYFGVGFGSGPCPSPPPDSNGVCVPATDKNTVVPIPLNGGAFELTLGEYSLTNPLYENVPGIPPSTFNDNPFTASLTAVVPEPSTWALLLVGFAGLAAAGSVARRKARLAA